MLSLRPGHLTVLSQSLGLGVVGGRHRSAVPPRGMGTHVPASLDPHSPPQFASCSSQGAMAASVSGPGSAQLQARSATGAESGPVSPGHHLPPRHPPHLNTKGMGKLRTSAKACQASSVGAPELP